MPYVIDKIKLATIHYIQAGPTIPAVETVIELIYNTPLEKELQATLLLTKNTLRS
tara:strand:+ start:120 stop:284 length:165 start_codon:yes stop_codon:yes gene_type:complete